MEMSINCIDYREPLLWIAIGLGTFAGVLIGRRIVAVLRRKPVSRSTLVAFPILFSIPLAIVLSYFILALLYAFIRGGIACVHFVRPALFVPGLLCAVDILVRTFRSDAAAAKT